MLRKIKAKAKTIAVVAACMVGGAFALAFGLAALAVFAMVAMGAVGLVLAVGMVSALFGAVAK